MIVEVAVVVIEGLLIIVNVALVTVVKVDKVVVVVDVDDSIVVIEVDNKLILLVVAVVVSEGNEVFSIIFDRLDDNSEVDCSVDVLITIDEVDCKNAVFIKMLVDAIDVLSVVDAAVTVVLDAIGFTLVSLETKIELIVNKFEELIVFEVGVLIVIAENDVDNDTVIELMVAGITVVVKTFSILEFDTMLVIVVVTVLLFVDVVVILEIGVEDHDI